MATAVCGGAQPGSRASFQTVPGLKVNQDSRHDLDSGVL